MNWMKAFEFLALATGAATIITFVAVGVVLGEGYASKRWWLLPATLFVICLIAGTIAVGLGA